MPFSRRNFFRGSLATAIPINADRGSELGWLGSPLPFHRFDNGFVYLDRTEAPYGPSQRVRSALGSFTALRANQYPREQLDALRGEVAALHASEPKNILLGCGSSEILQMAALTLATGSAVKKALIQASPTCSVIGSYARAVGANVIDVPLTKTFAHDLGQMLSRAANEHEGGVVYICNPNSPTGTLTDRADIQTFINKLSRRFVVVIDEAYCHFVSPHKGYSSLLDEPLNDPRVVVCRTFSKVYGLAGMRVGYAVGHPDTLKSLEETQLRFPVGPASAIAAIEAIKDSEYVAQAISCNANVRQEFMNQVGNRMLRGITSHANFVALDTLRPVDMVLAHLERHKVFVSPVAPPMSKYLRVSLGSAEDLREFWRVIDLLPPAGKMAM